MEKEADDVLAYLQCQGFSAYKVGGYVRDKLLGVPIHDIDIATSATPEQVMALFPHVIPTGIKHGTVTVGWKDCFFEVTTYRQETSYVNHRHPNQVHFVMRIEDDLSRRDFTINAMAMNRTGEVIDPYGGQEDLHRGILRAVGVPRQRFEEDALRILRGIRFSARFSLTIEEKTWLAMQETAEDLKWISKERIRDEVKKMLEGDHPLMAMDYLAAPGLFPFDDWNRIFRSIISHPCKEPWEEVSPLSSRWSLFFAMSGLTAESAYQHLVDWRFPKRFAHEIQLLLHFLNRPVTDERTAKKMLLKYEWKMIQEGLKAKRWLKKDEPFLEESIWLKWNSMIPIRQSKELAVGGRELIRELHRKAGPWLGKLIEYLFEQVAIWGLPNQRDVLLEEARKVLNHERTNIENL